MYDVPPTVLEPSASVLTTCGEPVAAVHAVQAPVASGQTPPKGTHAIFNVESTFDGLDGAVPVTSTAPLTDPAAVATVGAARAAKTALPPEHTR